MNLFKKTRITFAVLSSLISMSAYCITDVTIYADDGYPPYSYVENGVLKGSYPEVIPKLLKWQQNQCLNIKSN